MKLSMFPVAMLALLLAVLPVLGSAQANADNDPLGVFEAQVAVADRGIRARNAAFAEAYSEVLIKLSGQIDLVHSVLEQSNVNASTLVLQFRYLDDLDENGETQLTLQVSFNPQTVRRSAVELGLPLWALERGTTVVWIAMDSGIDRRLLGTGDDGAAIDALDQAASRRALPVLMPLFDLEDRAAVRVSDVWGGFADHVWQASSRYDAEFALLGRVYRTRFGWGARWVASDGQQQYRWTGQGDSLEMAIADGTERWADELARRFAVVQNLGGSDRLRIRVHGVDSLDRYAAMMDYLRGLSVIEGADPVALSGSIVEFDLDSAVDVASVAQTLSLGRLLVEVPRAQRSADAPQLVYRVVGQ